jgi:translation initiation factor 1
LLSGIETPPPKDAARPSDPSLAAPVVPKKGRVILRREKAHRGGKTVIIVHDFPAHITDAAIDEILRKLRKTCGCGGTVRDREIEIQGDQPAKIREILEAEGYRVSGVS